MSTDNTYWAINIPGKNGINPMSVASTARGAIGRWLTAVADQSPEFLMQIRDDDFLKLWRYYRRHELTVGLLQNGQTATAYLVRVSISCLQDQAHDWNVS